MNANEDDDIKLQRASASLRTDLQKILSKTLRKRNTGQVHRKVKATDLAKIFVLVKSICAV